MLQTAKKTTCPNVINAVRHGLPMPRGASLSNGEMTMVRWYVQVLDRKERRQLHGRVDWTRSPVEIAYNWCVAFRGHWTDLESYQRFLKSVERLQPPQIVTVPEYERWMAAIFYTVKENVEQGNVA